MKVIFSLRSNLWIHLSDDTWYFRITIICGKLFIYEFSKSLWWSWMDKYLFTKFWGDALNGCWNKCWNKLLSIVFVKITCRRITKLFYENKKYILMIILSSMICYHSDYLCLNWIWLLLWTVKESESNHRISKKNENTNDVVFSSWFQ